MDEPIAECGRVAVVVVVHELVQAIDALHVPHEA